MKSTEDGEGQTDSIGSEEVNNYLQAITKQPFTAKDFRTWAGTVLAAIALGKMQEVDDTRAAKLPELLGPGLITGATDDDPSGIATYSSEETQSE